MRRSAAVVVIVAAVLCGAPIHAQPKPPEYQVKAAFIYKFATYIRWPSPPAAQTPFVIGIIGKDPFGQALDAVVRGQSIQGRPIVITRSEGLSAALRVDVVFVSSSERGQLREILLALQKRPVLTVGDMNQFAELGGMINLVTTEDNRIRFDINKKALELAGLKAPSQLLGLARIVEAKRDGGRR